VADRRRFREDPAMDLRRLFVSARFRSRQLWRRSVRTLRDAPYIVRTGYRPTDERVCPDAADANFESHVRVYEFAAQFAVGKAVLDVGCGTGYGTALLAERGASQALGVDRARSAVRFARKRYGGQARFDVMDAQRLELEDSSFDLVISSENLEHLPDPTASIREIRRVLRSDGLLVLGTPNKEMSSPGKDHPSNPFHEKEFYFVELRELLDAFFSWVVIFENTAESVSELGRQMRAERVARGDVGFEVGDLETSTFGDLVVDLRPLANTHSFVAIACDRGAGLGRP
jgi:ubiquinone/menaquinone biosynthesis C-methylase UbiE